MTGDGVGWTCVRSSHGGKEEEEQMTDKNPFKKHLEEKQTKRKLEEQATAQVYADFVSSFDVPTSSSSHSRSRSRDFAPIPFPPSSKTKTFLRGGIFDPSKPPDEQQQQQQRSSEKAETYTLGAPVKPIGICEGVQTGKDAAGEEKKRTIEELRAEIQRRVEAKGRTSAPPPLPSPPQQQRMEAERGRCEDSDFSNSTNLYVGNLSPTVNEATLLAKFAEFGPVASVKIMWPRTEEEHARGRNCGFVAFMDRKNAESAQRSLNGSMLAGHEMRLEWSKAISPMPAFPLMLFSDPTTGIQRVCTLLGWPMTPELAMMPVSQAAPPPPTVFVKLPDDPRRLVVLNKVSRAIAAHGHQLEQVLMERKKNDPEFTFLFEADSPESIYYRWKVFSLLQGDSETRWRTAPFQMFVGGPWWAPPPIAERPDKGRKKSRSGQTILTATDADAFAEILRTLTISNSKICQAMGFCLDRAEAAEDVVELITESLTVTDVPIPLKIARLFLVSDVLHNSSAAVHNAFAFRTQ